MIRQLHTIESINERIAKHNIYLTAVRFDVPMSIWYGPNRVICRCKCGTLKSILIKPLLQGKPMSCGCAKHNQHKNALSLQDINDKLKGTKLTAISFADPYILKSTGKANGRRVNCVCLCGNTRIVHLNSIMIGDTISCRCSRKGVHRQIKYSQHHVKIYKCWVSMKKRCNNIDDKDYHRYGALGVKICDEWNNNYQPFLDWALLNGWENGLQLDKDIKGNGLLYSPETCCFVTPKVNCNKRKSTVLVTYQGITDTFTLTTERLGLKLHMPAIARRIKKGWSIDDAFSIPIRETKSKMKHP